MHRTRLLLEAVDICRLLAGQSKKNLEFVSAVSNQNWFLQLVSSVIIILVFGKSGKAKKRKGKCNEFYFLGWKPNLMLYRQDFAKVVAKNKALTKKAQSVRRSYENDGEPPTVGTVPAVGNVWLHKSDLISHRKRPSGLKDVRQPWAACSQNKASALKEHRDCREYY